MLLVYFLYIPKTSSSNHLLCLRKVKINIVYVFTPSLRRLSASLLLLFLEKKGASFWVPAFDETCLEICHKNHYKFVVLISSLTFYTFHCWARISSTETCRFHHDIFFTPAKYSYMYVTSKLKSHHYVNSNRLPLNCETAVLPLGYSCNSIDHNIK